MPPAQFSPIGFSRRSNLQPIAIRGPSVFQSGVLFLGYNFGLPVIVTDVDSLKDDILEVETGFVCRPDDPTDLARVLRYYFSSPLRADLSRTRTAIRKFAADKYSWEKVGNMTRHVYQNLLAR